MMLRARPSAWQHGHLCSEPIRVVYTEESLRIYLALAMRLPTSETDNVKEMFRRRLTAQSNDVIWPIGFFHRKSGGTKMSKRRLLMGGMVIVALVAIAAIACGDDDDDSEGDATAQLCSDLSVLSGAGAALNDLDSSSTVDDVKAAGQAYGDALQAVDESASDLAEVRAQPVDDAYDDLDAAISDIPGDATIEEGLASIQPALAAVDAAYAEAFSSVDCP